MLQGLRTVGFHVADIAAAKAWYTEVLGFGPYFDEPFYVGFSVGGYELGLLPADGDVQPGAGGDTTYWAVDDVDAAVGRLVQAGATLRDAPTGVGGDIVVAAVFDPFGNVLGLIRNPDFAPPLVHAAAGDVSERAIVVAAEVERSADEAFAMWSSSAGLARWWLPESRIELRPGGYFELLFMPAGEVPFGQRGSEGCRILSYLPGRMLSFTWNAPPHLPATRGRPTWVVIRFEPNGDAGCRVELQHLGWPASEWDSEPQWPQTFAYFEAAWARVFEAFTAPSTA